MTADTDHYLKPHAIRFGLPIGLLLLVLALLTVGLLQIAVKGQDRVALDASTTIARAALNAKHQSQEELVRDYSWWNAAVENLVFEFNLAWARENLDWLPDNFGVSEVFVFGPNREPVYTTLGDTPAEPDHPAWQNQDLIDVIERTQAQPNTPEAAITAYVKFTDGVRLISASKLLEETDKTGHPPYPEKGVLVVTRKIDQQFIGQVESDFQLRGLTLSTEPAGSTSAATLPLRGLSGQPVAYMIWTPPQPGTRLLEWLVVPLGAVFLLTGSVIAMIIVRARRASLALQQAFEARVAAQKKLEHSARHDPLTDLPNRMLFLEHLTTAIAHAVRHGSSFTLHYLDLDGFKNVNDTFGHPAGDDLLEQLASRFRLIVRTTDTIARFGGDEFAVLQRGTSDPEDARLLAERLIRAVEKPFEIEGHTTRVTLSVGIAFDIESEDPEEIIQMADRALYRAKREGGNRLACYDPSLDSRTTRSAVSNDRDASMFGGTLASASDI